MRYVYPDTSIWNRLCDEKVEPQALCIALENRGLAMALGFNVMYEIAKQFFGGSAGGVDRGRRLFEYALPYFEIGVPVVKENWALLVEEALDVTGNQRMLSCFRGESDYQTAIREIEKLCRGEISAETAQFFAGRKSAARMSRIEMRANLESRPDLKAFLHKIDENSLPEFLDRASMGREGAFLLLGHLCREFPKNSVPQLATVAELLLRSQRYPASSALTRSGLYLNWRCVKRGSLRGDLPDDTFHVVSAAYCDVFVTTEADQAKIASYVIPGIQTVVCSEGESVVAQLAAVLDHSSGLAARA